MRFIKEFKRISQLEQEVNPLKFIRYNANNILNILPSTINPNGFTCQNNTNFVTITNNYYIYFILNNNQNNINQYFYIAPGEKIDVPITENSSICCIGIIYKDNSTKRLGFYTSEGNHSIINDDELFFPILFIREFGTNNIFYDGIWYNKVTELNNKNINNLFKYNANILTILPITGKPILSFTNNQNSVNIISSSVLYFSVNDNTNTNQYFYTSSINLTVPIGNSKSICCIGLIYENKTTYHYGYYTSEGFHSEVAENEVFIPLLFIREFGTNNIIFDGEIYKYIQQFDKYNFKEKYSSGNLFLYEPYVNKEVLYATVDSVNNKFIFHCDSLQLCIIKNTLSTYGFLYASTLECPLSESSSIIVIGIKYTYNTYKSSVSLSYYGSDGSHDILQEGEYFEPIAVYTNVASNPTLNGGQLYNLLCNKEKIITLNPKLSNNILVEDNLKTIENLGCITNQFVQVSPLENIIIDSINNGIKLKQNIFVWERFHIRVHKSVQRLIFNTLNSPGFKICNYSMENGEAGEFEQFIEVNISNNQIICNGTTISYNFSQNNDYRFNIERIDKHVSISLTNLKTGITTSILTFNGTTTSNLGLLYDVIGVLNENTLENSILIKGFFTESIEKNPYLMIFGDSITVGWTSTIENGLIQHSYGYLTGEHTNKPYLISGRGGGNYTGLLGSQSSGYDYLGRLDSELGKLLPNVAMVTIGTNGGGTYQQYKDIVEKIINYGVYPILNTLPIRWNDDGVLPYIFTSNAAIMQIWKDYNIHGARFDLATTINNDGITPNPDLFVSDKVHPNDAGHLAMYNRILIDCPEIF